MTTSGDVAEIQTVECSLQGKDFYYRNGNHLFENPSIQSLKQTTYILRMALLYRSVLWWDVLEFTGSRVPST